MIPISTAALALWAALLFALERRFPAVPFPPAQTKRLGVNVALGLIVFALSPLVQWATARVMSGVQPITLVTAVFGPRMGLAVQLLLLDLWAYALHRAYHRVPMMWRLHAPHHLDAHLDVTSALRFHGGEILWSSLLRLIPLFLLGISLQTNMLYGAILFACALFHHSNVKLPPAFERALSKLIVTPSIHWVHHRAVQKDTDANYASILSIWDTVFQTASRTRRTPDMIIGVEGMAERPLAALLAFPLRQS